jgi:hypothetical protein
MPIRTSISDPDGPEAKEFARMLRDGPLPKTPKKPSAGEREPLVHTLESIPVGQNMSKQTWIDKWASPLIRTKFTLWEIEFGVYAAARTEHNETKTCTGVFIKAITRNRRGVQPMLRIQGKFDRTWYRQILDWIEENYYGG